MWSMLAPLAGKLGGALASQAGKGLMGLIGGGSLMNKGVNQAKNIAGGLGNEESIRSPFSNSQNILNRLGDITQYSGRGMDIATQSGNQAVRSAAMMGSQGGSAANAIKARLKTNAVGDIYGAYNQSMQDTVLPGQMKVDENVFSELNKQNAEKRNINMNLAQGNIDMGNSLIPNLSETIYGKKGILGSIGNKLKSFG